MEGKEEIRREKVKELGSVREERVINRYYFMAVL